MPKRARRLYPTNYATDVTDDQWVAVEPLVTTVSAKGGRPPEVTVQAVGRSDGAG